MDCSRPHPAYSASNRLRKSNSRVPGRYFRGNRKSDGTTIERYGKNPNGIAFFDAGGRYIITVMRSDRAKYASNALWQGTSEENKETADGTITYFGTYAISEADSSIAIHIEGSSFPNWNGMNQKRLVSLAGDQLTLTVRPPAGGVVDVIWKRAD